MQDVPVQKRLEDYQITPYTLSRVQLCVQLGVEATVVQATLSLAPREQGGAMEPLELHGKDLELQSVRIDGVPVSSDAYSAEGGAFTLHCPPTQAFALEITTRIYPERNMAMEGLYVSQGAYMTQCESEGFRRIAYFYDRPDVMALYRVRIEADAARYPYLLSNGNCIGKGILPEGRHWVEWEDPFAKPSYLFALVAGNFAVLEDHFTTSEGREVKLSIYAHPQDVARCGHAMSALQRTMKWDEDTFGRVCDLDEYKIVVARDFNMGAMENKGLNIFNHALVVGDPSLSTDTSLLRIDHVVAHEYLHNWSGNRVTCRDWFQLCLKEGLTVFREHLYAQNTGSAATQRLAEIQYLREVQFAEDASPLSHPPRPDRYMEINNFYTVTVYEKGGEVFGMLRRLLGAVAFRQGLDAYFDKFDGMAVTVEDLIAVMETTTGRNLQQFLRWFTCAGTPQVKVESHYDAQLKTYSLCFSQRVETAYAHAPADVVFHIPVSLALLDATGASIPFALEAGGEKSADPLYELREATQTLVISGIEAAPTPCFFQGFSAPVELEYDYSFADLQHLFAHAKDPYCRWEAGQRLWKREFATWMNDRQVGTLSALSQGLLVGLQGLLASDLDPAFVAACLEIPSFVVFALGQSPVDVEGTLAVRRGLERAVARVLEPTLWQVYRRYEADLGYTQAGIASRQLKSLCLELLNVLDTSQAEILAYRQFMEAKNMTDRFAALSIFATRSSPMGKEVLEAFYKQYRQEDGVIDMWFQAQGRAEREDALEVVVALCEHPDFSWTNPNRLRALISSFCRHNPQAFHAADGSGYRFCREKVQQIEGQNPQLAAAFVRVLVDWKRYDTGRQGKMRQELETLRAHSPSKEVLELVTQALT